MRTYQWWQGQKRRVQKKYSLLCCWYYSPKELREWYKNWKRQKARKRKSDKYKR